MLFFVQNIYKKGDAIYLGLFNIIRAAITPGTQPQSVNKNTIMIDPQPLPITANGGKKIANKTLSKLIYFIIY